LDYWDDQLVEQGSIVMAQRRAAVAAIAAQAAVLHSRLSGGREALEVIYRPAFGEAGAMTIAEGTSVAVVRARASPTNWARCGARR